MKRNKMISIDADLFTELGNETNASALIESLLIDYYNKHKSKLTELTTEQKIAQIEEKKQELESMLETELEKKVRQEKEHQEYLAKQKRIEELQEQEKAKKRELGRQFNEWAKANPDRFEKIKFDDWLEGKR